MRYEVRTSFLGDGKFAQSVDLIPEMRGEQNVRETIVRQVIDTQDAQVRATLEKLGWRHDGGIAAIDVPDDPIAVASWPHEPHNYHRVTVTDIIAMERKLNAFKRAFNY
jgi:hypothetical protein